MQAHTHCTYIHTAHTHAPPTHLLLVVLRVRSLISPPPTHKYEDAHTPHTHCTYIHIARTCTAHAPAARRSAHQFWTSRRRTRACEGARTRSPASPSGARGRETAPRARHTAPWQAKYIRCVRLAVRVLMSGVRVCSWRVCMRVCMYAVHVCCALCCVYLPSLTLNISLQPRECVCMFMLAMCVLCTCVCTHAYLQSLTVHIELAHT